jgi:hypothetical protein
MLQNNVFDLPPGEQSYDLQQERCLQGHKMYHIDSEQAPMKHSKSLFEALILHCLVKVAFHFDSHWFLCYQEVSATYTATNGRLSRHA